MARSSRRRLREATGEILRLTIQDGQPLVLVWSPPGAGKTHLVTLAAAAGVLHAGLNIAVAVPQNEQLWGLARRLRRHFPPMPIRLLLAKDVEPPADLADPASGISLLGGAGELQSGPGITLATAHKWRASAPRIGSGTFDLLLCDEAYQVMSKIYSPAHRLAAQVLLVGDPGQLPPVDTLGMPQVFDAAGRRPHRPAPEELRRLYPDAPAVHLPASRRLVGDTVSLVQPAFYPQHPFGSAAHPGERRLDLGAVPRARAGSALQAIDRALDKLARGASIIGLVLPPRHGGAGEVDGELSELMAAVAARLLERGACWRGQRALAYRDVALVDSHVASGAELELRLLQRGAPAGDVRVATPERHQGGTYALSIVKHPLSGLPATSGFALAPGRMCVSLSRHLLGCIVVTRDGVGDALEGYRPEQDGRPLGAEDSEWHGWRAHHHIWSELERMGRLIRA
jgi:hypothetical protein